MKNCGEGRWGEREERLECLMALKTEITIDRQVKKKIEENVEWPVVTCHRTGTRQMQRP